MAIPYFGLLVLFLLVGGVATFSAFGRHRTHFITRVHVIAVSTWNPGNRRNSPWDVVLRESCSVWRAPSSQYGHPGTHSPSPAPRRISGQSYPINANFCLDSMDKILTRIPRASMPQARALDTPNTDVLSPATPTAQRPSDT